MGWAVRDTSPAEAQYVGGPHGKEGCRVSRAQLEDRRC